MPGPSLYPERFDPPTHHSLSMARVTINGARFGLGCASDNGKESFAFNFFCHNFSQGKVLFQARMEASIKGEFEQRCTWKFALDRPLTSDIISQTVRHADYKVCSRARNTGNNFFILRSLWPVWKTRGCVKWRDGGFHKRYLQYTELDDVHFLSTKDQARHAKIYSEQYLVGDGTAILNVVQINVLNACSFN